MEKSAFDKDSMRITYERHKTRGRRMDKALTSVRVEPEIYDIMERYRAPKSSKYLFRFADYIDDVKTSSIICDNIKSMCRTRNFDMVTPYWFRHTWATIARNDCDISKDDIDLCLAHSGNNPMADVYIRPDWSRIDRANRKVLDFVFGAVEK